MPPLAWARTCPELFSSGAVAARQTARNSKFPAPRCPMLHSQAAILRDPGSLPSGCSCLHLLLSPRGTRTGVSLSRQPASFHAGCPPWLPAAGVLSWHVLPPRLISCCPLARTPASTRIAFLVRVRLRPKTGLIRQRNLAVPPTTRSSLSSALLPGASWTRRAFAPLGSGRDLLGPTRLSPRPSVHRTAGYTRPDYVKADRPGLWPLGQVHGLCGEAGSGRAVPLSDLALPSMAAP